MAVRIGATPQRGRQTDKGERRIYSPPPVRSGKTLVWRYCSGALTSAC